MFGWSVPLPQEGRCLVLRDLVEYVRFCVGLSDLGFLCVVRVEIEVSVG